MKKLIALLSLVIFAFGYSAFSQPEAKPKENHAHENEEAHAHNESEHEDPHEPGAHEDEHEESGDSHESHKGHGEEGHEEGGANVGPDKGILEASEENGIKLAPQAIKNFGLETVQLAGSSPWTVPTSAILHSLEETNIYRVRNGFYKRIDFNLSKRSQEQMTISSQDLNAGDEVVISGVGFLRIAELTAFGGAPEGHSH